MKHRSLFLFALTLCMTVLLVLLVFANSAEPPCLTIVVVGAPEDLELSLVDADGAETIAFPLALQEKRIRAIPYAIIANLVSMFVGGLMITHLPLAL